MPVVDALRDLALAAAVCGGRSNRFWVDEEMPRIDCGGAGLATERVTVAGEAVEQVDGTSAAEQVGMPD
ncbi:hypothetical protein M0R45_025631 [Rubus argutus]|uniref:Uncharacterized protein n=1 Tax=Rubus argutus TaxID=59490 RepID=A0AAW1WXR1_RUBAR